MFDFQKRKEFEQMNKAFDAAYNELMQLCKSAESSSESEEEERPRNKHSRKHREPSASSSEQEDSPIKARGERQAECAKALRWYQSKLRQLTCEKSVSKQLAKSMPTIVGQIEERINHILDFGSTQLFTKEMCKALDLKGTEPFFGKIKAAVQQAYEVGLLGDIVPDNPGTYTSTGRKLSDGRRLQTVETPSEVLGGVRNLWIDYDKMDPRTAAVWSRATRPEDKSVSGRIADKLKVQGRTSTQTFTPRLGTQPVTVSNHEVALQIIKRTKNRTSFLSNTQVTELESKMNRGEKIPDSILRRLFDDGDDGRI